MYKDFKSSEKFSQSRKKIFAVYIIISVLYVLIAFAFSVDKISVKVFFTAATLLFIVLIISFLFNLIKDMTYYKELMIESDLIRTSSYIDSLTGMPNRLRCDLIFQTYEQENDIAEVGCAVIMISNLVTINQSVNRDAGNQAIIDFCEILKDIAEDYGFIGRNSGNEFLLVVKKCNTKTMQSFFEQLGKRLQRYNTLDLNQPIEIYYKYVLNKEFHGESFNVIVTEAYHRLHTSHSRKNESEDLA